MNSVGNIYLIKDLARISGHSIYTLKFYLKLGLIRESGRSPETRFRYFDDTSVAQLVKIRNWRKGKKSLAEIRHMLNSAAGSGLGAEGSGLLPRAQSPEPRATEVG